MRLLFVVCLMAPLSLAATGVDISAATPASAFTCLSQSGYIFSIIRGYTSYGAVDPNVNTNIQNSNKGGMKNTDVYLFPCYPCGNPQIQAQNLTIEISNQNYGMVWLAVQVYAWDTNQVNNQKFITTITNALTYMGQSVGIYTSYSDWQSIVGLNWSGVSKYPLWYYHHDDVLSFADFTPFGGWTQPAIKQYNGEINYCGATLDQNFYP